MVGRDPVERAGDGRDLYDVATWEPRGALDRLSAWLWGAGVRGARAAVVGLAALIVLSQLGLSAVAVADDPALATYVVLSLVPALGLALYVYRADVTSDEPLRLLVGTFMLGFAFAGFAAVVNSLFAGLLGVGLPLVAFFFLVVGPVEETVKVLAVRLYAYRAPAFDAVVDGAVYGAMAGLGFAAIENTVYITNQYLLALEAAGSPLDASASVAALRSFAGPGHVIYSAYAGYYLGLAKFNPGRRGPIVVKGLLVAAAIHGLYNSLVSNLFEVAGALGLGAVPPGVLFVGFVLVFDGAFGYLLYRKLRAYRRAYLDLGAGPRDAPETVERDEFVWDRS